MKSVSLNIFDEIHASIAMKFHKTTKLEFRGVAIDSSIDCDDAQNFGPLSYT